MFGELYGIKERIADNQGRIPVTTDKEEFKQSILIVKGVNDRYCIYLLSYINKLLDRLESDKDIINEIVYKKRKEEIEKIFASVKDMQKIDQYGRIRLPEDYLNSLEGRKAIMFGRKDNYELFTSMKEFDKYKKQLFQKK